MYIVHTYVLIYIFQNMEILNYKQWLRLKFNMRIFSLDFYFALSRTFLSEENICIQINHKS